MSAIPGLTRLKWTSPEHGLWVISPYDVAQICVRSPSIMGMKQNLVPPGKWEVILGDCYWSRDEDRYFDGAEQGKAAAEQLFKQYLQNVLKRFA